MRPARHVRVLAFLIAMSGAAASQTLLTSATWPVSAGGNGRLYAVYLSSFDWPTARAFAQGLAPGADLATPTTGGENAFIFSLISAFPALWTPQASGGGSYGPWIGGMLSGATWTWVSGEPFCFANWAQGEPNSGCIAGPMENRIHYGSGAAGASGPLPTDQWNDLWQGGCAAGSIVPTGFVVEYTTFDTTITQSPAGITITIGTGPPFSLYFNPFVIAAPGAGDPCLDGWFFGLDTTLLGLLSQASFPPPFFGTLPATGTVTFFLPTPGIGALQVDYVGILMSPSYTILASGVPKSILTF